MFHRCKDEKEGKNLFRKLAKHLHPDFGGENELFILLKESYEIYEEFCTALNNQQETKQKKGNPSKYSESEFDIDFGDEKLEIFEEIRKYAKTHKKFNLSYIDSVWEFLEEKGFISSSQYNKLVKVYYAFRMDKE